MSKIVKLSAFLLFAKGTATNHCKDDDNFAD